MPPFHTEFNPFVRLEFRSRWRRPLAFLTVFTFVALLAGLMGWNYLDQSTNSLAQDLDRTSAFSYRLFVQLTWVQTLAWAMIAVLLTAPSIATERERGLLQDLQLSPLEPRQVVHGKLFSTLAFCGVFLLAPLPIMTIVFQMGGVSPLEFVVAFQMQGAVTLGAASSGLMVSSGTRRADQALFYALILAFCLGLTAILGANGITQHISGSFLPTALTIILIALAWTPVCLAVAAENVRMIRFSEADEYHLSPYSQPSTVNAVAQKRVHRPVAPAFLSTASRTELALRAMMVADEKNNTASSEDNPTPEPALAASQPRKLWPWAGRFSFSNPILQRDVRARLTIRSDPHPTEAWPLLWIMGVFGIAMAIYLRREETNFSYSLWFTTTLFWLLGIIALTTAIAAGAFTRERENNTLAHLLLATLSPLQIVVGKTGAPLVLCAYFSAFFVPLWLPALLTAPPLLTLSTLLSVLAVAWWGASWGAFFSWICRHTAIAAGGAMTSTLFCIFAIFLLPSAMPYSPLLVAWRKNSAVQWWNAHYTSDWQLAVLVGAAALAALLLIGGVVLHLVILWGLRPAALEKEPNIWTTDLTRHIG